MGYNKHWPHELCYDTFHSGLAIPHLYLEQVIQHIIAIYSLFTNKETHILIMNALQIFQIQIGTSGNIFETPQEIYHGSSTWIKQWINELSDFNLSMRIPHTLNFKPQRINDRTLMDVIIQHQKNNTNIEQLNICRQYLRIIFLSDMITPDG